MKRFWIISALSLITAPASFAQQVETVQTKTLNSAGAQTSYYVNQEGVLKEGFSFKAATDGSFFLTANKASNGVASPWKNSVRVETFQKPIASTFEATNAQFPDKQTSYDFVDGLGRPLQSINVKSSPGQNDQVSFHQYDEFGRELKSYLSYTNNGNGEFRLEPEKEQSAFYNSSPYVARDSEPYSIQEYYSSPLNQPSKTYAPGWSWHNDTESKPSTSINRFNLANEVPFVAVSNSIPIFSGNYAVNTLVVTESTSSSGLIKLSFADAVGRQVMSKEGAGSLWRTTYYTYDYSGNLCYVFPPAAVERLAEFQSATNKQEFLNRWCFQYKYDLNNRQIGKKLPGADWIKTIYDKWDRVVFVQDGEQRTNNQWIYSKYDIYNRVVITGITTGTESDLTSAANNATVRYEIRASNNIGYMNVALPSHDVNNILTITYYDDYAFLSYTGWEDNGQVSNYNFVTESGYPNTSDVHQIAYPQSIDRLTTVKGYVTGAKTKLLNTTTWLNSVTYYDKNYRAIQQIGQNHLATVDRASHVYDFSGNVLKSLQSHAGSTMVVQKEFTYDHAGRLTRSYHQINNGPKVLLSELKYNELGQVIEKNLHSLDNGATFLQSVDYRYNIQGWLTHINNSKLGNDQGVTNNDSNDLFGMEIVYNQDVYKVNNADTKKFYHGNISAIKWKTNDLRNPSQEKIYAFDYDAFDRLLAAKFATLNGSTWNGNANMFNEAMTYDINGNIKTLNRNGSVAGAVKEIDNLLYHYSSLTKGHSNALRHVVDKSVYWTGDPSFGYTEKAITHSNFLSDTEGQNGTEYEYYLDGNVKSDLNKEITQIFYNHLDFPEKIQLSGNREIEYSYDAGGNKLKAVVRTTSPTTTLSVTDYVGAIQYYNGKLASLETVEGRVVKGNTGFEYEYFIRDHQNNVRVVFGSGGTSSNYLATIETVRSSKESSDFGNIPQDPTFNHTLVSSEIPAPTMSVVLNAALPGGKAVGITKMLSVKGGDNVQTDVFAKYATVFTGANDVIPNIAALVTTGFGVFPTGETQAAYNAINGYLPAKAGAITKTTQYPKAYLCYILLEKTGSTFTAKQFGYASIDDRALNGWQQLSLDVHVPETIVDGQLYVYVANETSTTTAPSVYFDDLSIAHQSVTPSLQVYQSSDYYPFGLSFNRTEVARSFYDAATTTVNDVIFNSKLFQEQELQRGFDIGWYHYKFRMHDPALGRFAALDPLSEKFAYNSIYAFSENRLIDGIELEGAEWLPRFDEAVPYGDNYFTNGINFFNNNLFAPALNFLGPDLYNSGVDTYLKIRDDGFLSYGGAVGDEFYNMGAGAFTGLKNFGVGLYDDATTKSFSQNMEGFKHLETYETPFKFAVALYGTKNFFNVKTPTLNPGKGVAPVGKAPNPPPSTYDVLQSAARHAEAAIPQNGGVAGTLKHGFSTKFMKQWEAVNGSRGLEYNQYFNHNGRGFLDVVDHTNKIIYDWKFGTAYMSKAQYTKYSLAYPGYSILIVKP